MLAVGVSGGGLDIFPLAYPFSCLSPSIGRQLFLAHQIRISMGNQNLSWVYGVDRKICPSGSLFGISRW